MGDRTWSIVSFSPKWSHCPPSCCVPSASATAMSASRTKPAIACPGAIVDKELIASGLPGTKLNFMAILTQGSTVKHCQRARFFLEKRGPISGSIGNDYWLLIVRKQSYTSKYFMAVGAKIPGLWPAIRLGAINIIWLRCQRFRFKFSADINKCSGQDPGRTAARRPCAVLMK